MKIPSTGEIIGTIAAGTADDVDQAVKAAQNAFHGAWGALNATERGRILARMGKIVETRLDELAQM